MNRTVFIPHLPMKFDRASDSLVPSIDLNPAAEYGELKRMTDDSGENQIQQIKSAVEETMCPDDYVLAVGDVVSVAAAIAYASEKFGKVEVLRWDRKRHSYNTMEVKL